METGDLSHDVADYVIGSDGFMSWEEFYGSSNENLVESILEMYDLLIGRSSEIKGDFLNTQTEVDFKKDQYFAERANAKDFKTENLGNWCNVIDRDGECKCTEKSEPEITSQKLKGPEISNIRNSRALKQDANFNCRSEPALPVFQNNSVKCELKTCPAGFSTPTTPVQDRLKKFEKQSPLPYKRNDNYFHCFTRRSSVSSLASSSSSSSGASSCYESRRHAIPRKLGFLASIESFEDDSDIERDVQKDESCTFSEELEEEGFAFQGLVSLRGVTGSWFCPKLSHLLPSLSEIIKGIHNEFVRGLFIQPFQDLENCRKYNGSEDSGLHIPCTSLPVVKSKYLDPHLSYMDKVVTEIIDTEEVYVTDLRQIIEGYFLKWKSLPDFALTNRLGTLFGNIEAVFNFNSLFLKDLKQCGLDPVKVAQCFVRNNAGFSVYTEYCTNYPKTVTLLTELMRQEGAIRIFRERQAALQHTLPLGSYLLKPVQRILKYHLLLRNIVKQYSNGIEGYKDIVDALRTMTEIAQHINEMKRRHEHKVRVQEIQSLLLGWEREDLTTFGELCAEGTFRMYGAKALRHVFLFDKMLLITKKKEGEFLDYKAHINCSNLMLIESVPGEPLSFHVIPFDNPKLQYTLQCRNLEQKREWTLQLKRVILENYNAVIPSHARQLVMELGQNKIEDESSPNKLLLKKHHLAPEYLERRKQERRKNELNKYRMRRHKSSETGQKEEDQANKLETSQIENNPTQVSHPQKDKESELSSKSESTEKLEIKTLEQIVTQILKQNRDFEKILKRQRQIISKSRNLSSRRRKKRETVNEGKNVYDTIKNLKFLRTPQPQPTVETEVNSDSDYVTLMGENQDCESCGSENAKSNARRFLASVNITNDSEPPQLKDSFDDSIPTSPSVWLKQQVQHLPTPTKKAGSLPRSFHISSESSTANSRFFRDFRVSIERPFTIASDKITSTMLFEGMERFCRSQFGRSKTNNASEEISSTEGLNTPGASLDQINIHPEYKIYRRSMTASSLKSAFSSVQSKLSHMKIDIVQKLEFEKKLVNRERKASKVLYVLAKNYQKALRSKQKDKNYDNEIEPFMQLDLLEAKTPVYKQGSKSLGKRLANFTDSECRVHPIRTSKKAAALLGLHSNYVLSLTSIPPDCESSLKKNNNEETFSKDDDIDESVDFYERRFDKMTEELSKDNAVQDQEIDALSYKTLVRTPLQVPSQLKKKLFTEKVQEVAGDLPVYNLAVLKEEIYNIQ